MQESDGDARYWLPPQENGKPLVLTKARKDRGDVVGVVTDRGGREFRSLAEPLEYYVARETITGRQYRAGKRLHSLWVKANPSLFVQVRYEDTDGGAKALSFAPPGFAAVEYREVLFSIKDRRARDVVYAVCCWGFHACQATDGVSERNARRIGVRLLKEGLDTIADHLKYD